MSSPYLLAEEHLLAADVLQQGIERVEVSQCLQLVVQPLGHARVPLLDAEGGICSHDGEARGGKVGSRVETQLQTRGCGRLSSLVLSCTALWQFR